MIAQDGEYLVFVEVKYRGSGHTGSSLAAVDKKKTICDYAGGAVLYDDTVEKCGPAMQI